MQVHTPKHGGAELDIFEVNQLYFASQITSGSIGHLMSFQLLKNTFKEGVNSEQLNYLTWLIRAYLTVPLYLYVFSQPRAYESTGRILQAFV